MTSHLPRDLGDGLVLRRATIADADRLAAFNADTHRYPPNGPEPDEKIRIWTRDLATKPPPGFDVGDITIVEDIRIGSIVSTLNLISQTWSYGGVDFGVGRPELVGTDPRYRRRGLVRIQMEEIHRWSAERGQKVQSITGIPFFYRQFGYEMALARGGGRSYHRAAVPTLPSGQIEPYRVRPATTSDIPFMADVYESAERRHAVTCRRTLAAWQYELTGRSQGSDAGRSFAVVEDAMSGEAIGFFAYFPFLTDSGEVIVTYYEIAGGTSWLAATPSVSRYLVEVGAKMASTVGEREFVGINFNVDPSHPSFEVLSDRFLRVSNPYAWYIRVPDVADFLSHVRPTLERRLAESVVVGHSGELKLSFFDDGCVIRLEGGRITSVDEWKPSRSDEGSVTFPGLTFLQLLFGYRSLADLEFAYADCHARSLEARVVTNALFPKATSDVWPIA
jgi:hypothetical protein